MKTVTEFVFPLLLVLVPIFCIFLLVRLHRLHVYFESRIMQPWREAIEQEDWAMSVVYQQHAHDFANDLTKLLFQPWRKLPK